MCPSGRLAILIAVMPRATRAARKMTVGLPVRHFPADLKTALAQRADEAGTNFSSLAVKMLADEFGVAYQLQARKSRGVGLTDDVNIRMPVALRRRINARAKMRGVTAAELVIETLRARLDVPLAA